MRVIDERGLVYDCQYIHHAVSQDPKYALPKLKKYPLPDRAHVKSAIKFFNYVSPRYEKILAYAILKRMNEYGMSFDDITVGDNNRFKKYVPKSDHLSHHGIMGMHWGIRRFQPYPSGYRGDGEYIGKRNKIKNALKEAKKEYKERKISAKEPYIRAKKRNSEAYDRYSQADDDKYTVEALTEEAYIDLEEQRDQLKEAKAYYKDRKKFGSIEQEREAKQGIKDAEKRIERARLNVEKALMDERAVKKTLEEASRDFDESYAEMQVQKALYKENKKLAKQRLNEIKQQLKEEKKGIEAEQKQHALDYDKKYAGDDTSTKLPQKDKNSRAAEQKELLDKADAADKARRDFIESKIKKYNPKNSEERDIAIAKVEKANAQKLKKLYDSSTEAYKRYDASRLKQRDFNKARSLRKRGFTYTEIAERLGVPPTTVWGILNY